ncbi:MAG TPA: hypothetical protein VIX80_07340 [Candidatus Kapabacteria bacterium]
MKQLLSFLSILALTAMINGCTVSKDFSFDIDYDLCANEINSTSYSATDTVYGKTYSSDFDKYKEDISNVDVESATFTILTSTVTSPSQEIVKVTASVADVSGGAFTEIGSAININLTTKRGVETPLDLTQAGKDKIETLLLGSDGGGIFKFEGTSNDKPVIFCVKFKLHLKATYEKTIP